MTARDRRNLEAFERIARESAHAAERAVFRAKADEIRARLGIGPKPEPEPQPSARPKPQPSPRPQPSAQPRTTPPAPSHPAFFFWWPSRPLPFAVAAGVVGCLVFWPQLLFAGIALVLRNVWVWLLFTLAKGKWSPEPHVFLALLRFRELLLWITEVAGPPLGAGQKQGIDLETYQRLTENT